MDVEHATEFYSTPAGTALGEGEITHFAASQGGDQIPVGVVAFEYKTPTTSGIKISPQAFSESIANLQAKGRKLPCLYNHNESKPLGSFDFIASERGKLKATGFLDTRLEAVPQALIAREIGALNECSVGFLIQQSEWEPIPEGEPRGRWGGNEYMLITKARLIEISLVSAGAHPNTKVMSAADYRQATPTKSVAQLAQNDHSAAIAAAGQILLQALKPQ